MKEGEEAILAGVREGVVVEDTAGDFALDGKDIAGGTESAEVFINGHLSHGGEYFFYMGGGGGTVFMDDHEDRHVDEGETGGLLVKGNEDGNDEGHKAGVCMSLYGEGEDVRAYEGGGEGVRGRMRMRGRAWVFVAYDQAGVEGGAVKEGVFRAGAGEAVDNFELVRAPLIKKGDGYGDEAGEVSRDIRGDGDGNCGVVVEGRVGGGGVGAH